jgi:hypothetical protein
MVLPSVANAVRGLPVAELVAHHSGIQPPLDLEVKATPVWHVHSSDYK